MRRLATLLMLISTAAAGQYDEALVKAALTAHMTVETCSIMSPNRATGYRADHAAWRKTQGTEALERTSKFRRTIEQDLQPQLREMQAWSPAEKAKAADVCEQQLMPALRKASR